MDLSLTWSTLGNIGFIYKLWFHLHFISCCGREKAHIFPWLSHFQAHALQDEFPRPGGFPGPSKNDASPLHSTPGPLGIHEAEWEGGGLSVDSLSYTVQAKPQRYFPCLSSLIPSSQPSPGQMELSGFHIALRMWLAACLGIRQLILLYLSEGAVLSTTRTEVDLRISMVWTHPCGPTHRFIFPKPSVFL